MKIARPLLVSGGLVSAMAAASQMVLSRLGDKPVATHFGVNGPDRFEPATTGVWQLPLVALGVTLLFAILPLLMPKRGRLERSSGAYLTVWMAVVVLLAALHAVILATALGRLDDPTRLVFVLVGVLLIVLGNLMGKVRYNYVFGVRTPWTLASERVWDKTHRAVGPWFMLWGVAMAAAALFAPQDIRAAVVIGGAAVIGVGSFVYSYLAARREGDV